MGSFCSTIRRKRQPPPQLPQSQQSILVFRNRIRMKLVFLLVGLATLSTAQPLQQEELVYPDDKRVEGLEAGYEPRNNPISRADLLDYLAFLEYQYKQQQEEEQQPLLEQEQQKQVGPMKVKRYWRNRWLGNKYRDNKSYGFWITALNKAGNYKRGKRAEPFVPGMSYQQPPYNLMSALAGEKDNLKELIPDHDFSKEAVVN